MASDSAMPDSPLPTLPPRRPESHKGSFGRALLLGGSRGMSGAIALAGMAALRGGAGLVQLGVPAECQAAIAAYEPSYLCAALPADRQGKLALAARDSIRPLAAAATAVGCGPGMGQSIEITALIAWLYRTLEKPLVVDADGLNALAAAPQALECPAGPRVLTPHPGEFARLVRQPRLAPADRQAAARELAARYHAVVVLKGHQTIITDGVRMAINRTGNPGLATGGTGDVLTGLIVALICQSLAPMDAARLGAHLHGLAGDLAAADLGQVSLIASDLIAYLPRAFLARA